MKAKEMWIQSIAAGLCIGIGGALYLAIDSKVIGALFFTLGLFTICTRGFHLFTGRLGYALDNPPSYLLGLCVTWCGNLIGTNLVALMLRATRQCGAMAEKAAVLCQTKLDDSLISLFLLAVFCNVLMYIAVDGFKNNPHELGKYLGLFLCVAGFILAGFEHCIANMFYFGMAWMWSGKALLYLLVMTAGNFVGGLILPALKKLI